MLYVALGRRLGYPMHLVSAKAHLFCRWDDGKGVRVNMEAANSAGFVSHSDDHYRKWPATISPEEEKRGLLRNMSARESLAVFLSTRAICLTGKRGADSILAAAQAFKLAPPFPGIVQSMESAVYEVLPPPEPVYIPVHQEDDPMTPRPGMPQAWSPARSITPAVPQPPSRRPFPAFQR